MVLIRYGLQFNRDMRIGMDIVIQKAGPKLSVSLTTIIQKIISHLQIFLTFILEMITIYDLLPYNASGVFNSQPLSLPCTLIYQCRKALS